ncbi:hypothetical protein H8D79_01800 [PVC group bacterium]|nr:hypothetical protein [PVC group bacterium]
MRCVNIIVVLATALLTAGSAQAQICDEQVTFDTDPGTIICHHTQTEFNCCAWIDFSVTIMEFSISIVEREEYDDGPCYCNCCFDNEIVIGGLEPGLYVVTIWKIALGGAEYVGTWEVEVDGQSAPFVETTYEPCVQTTVGDDSMWSWGTIKSLYQ